MAAPIADQFTPCYPFVDFEDLLINFDNNPRHLRAILQGAGNFSKSSLKLLSYALLRF